MSNKTQVESMAGL